MNARNIQREAYIFSERQKGRTYKDIGQELGITQVRVRQVYERVCQRRRQEYFKTHPEEYAQWWENPRDKKWSASPYV